MNFAQRFKPAQVAAAVGALCAISCGMLLYEFPFGKGLIRSSYELLQVARGERRIDGAVMVYMDELSHQRLKQPLNGAWDRSLHAQLIDRLTAAGARAIVFDIVFSDPNPGNPESDQRLATAIRNSARTIVAAENIRIGYKQNQMVPPFPLLLDAAAGVGSTELLPDSDLVVREHTPEDTLPALSWAAAEFAKAPVTQQTNANNEQRWINYYGPPNFIPGKSYFEALDPALVPDDFFRGKVVFVGARILTKFAGDRKDEFSNPFTFWLSPKLRAEKQALFMAGVEVQATCFLNLARGDWLRRWPRNVELLVLLGSGLICGVGLVRFRPIWATAVAGGGMLLVAAGAYLMFLQKLIWFPWLLLIIQIVAALFWSVLFNSIMLYVQKKLYEQTLRLYLPPKLVRKFARSRELLKPGAEKQTLTLLFSDIADFTSISEGMDGDELQQMMNAYFQRAVAKCIHKADGTVAKYMGDSIFAFWNAPDEQDDHPERACDAALRFAAESAEPVHGRLLRTRIGLHTGEANVGNFGSEERVDYTALGENVNLASRLEGLNKHLGTHCLLSGATRAALRGEWVTRSLGNFQLKGFQGLVAVHELVAGPGQGQSSLAWREAFAEALNNYEQRNLEFAELGFRRVLELKPGDGPARFYLQRIEELSKETLPDNWATYTVLKEK
jgi:adenylate cyclase